MRYGSGAKGGHLAPAAVGECALGYFIQIVYVVVCFVLVIHCVQRRVHYPLFGGSRFTKFVWFASFALVNPFVNLAYVVFGVLFRTPTEERPSRHLPLSRSIAGVYLALVIVLYNLPLGPTHGPSVLTKDMVEEGHKVDAGQFNIHAHVGTIEANNTASSSASTSHPNPARFAMGDISVVCDDAHGLTAAIASQIQHLLASSPHIERVSLFPSDVKPERGARMPDATLTLRVHRIKEIPLPLGRKVDAVIVWQFSRTPLQGSSHYNTEYSPPVVDFNVNGRIEHTSTSQHISLGEGKYVKVAENIAGQIDEYIQKHHKDQIEKNGLMPKLPDSFHGTYVEAPDFPFIASGTPDELVSGTGLLRHNVTAWRFSEPQDDDAALADYERELKEDGWNGDATSYHLHMSRGSESIDIFREKPRSKDFGQELHNNPELHPAQPMCARYERAFSQTELNAAAETLLGEKAPADTLLLFKRFFRDSELKERFWKHVEQMDVTSVDSLLALAKHYYDEGREEKAEAAFMKARIMTRTEKGRDSEEQDFKKLAKDLGHPEWVKQNLTKSDLIDAGFIDALTITKPQVFTRGVDEPLTLFQPVDEGILETLTYRIRPGADAGTYHLTEFKKNKHMWSLGEDNFSEYATKWNWYQADHPLTVDIKALDTNRFQFTIRPTNTSSD
jgi:hypothetical protein